MIHSMYCYSPILEDGYSQLSAKYAVNCAYVHIPTFRYCGTYQNISYSQLGELATSLIYSKTTNPLPSDLLISCHDLNGEDPSNNLSNKHFDQQHLRISRTANKLINKVFQLPFRLSDGA